MTPLILAAVLLAACAFALHRNNCVLIYRLHMGELVHYAAGRDIKAHREWEWRYEALRAVSYEEQFFKFWKPLDSFYPDKSFTTS